MFVFKITMTYRLNSLQNLNRFYIRLRKDSELWTETWLTDQQQHKQASPPLVAEHTPETVTSHLPPSSANRNPAMAAHSILYHQYTSSPNKFRSNLNNSNQNNLNNFSQSKCNNSNQISANQNSQPCGTPSGFRSTPCGTPIAPLKAANNQNNGKIINGRSGSRENLADDTTTSTGVDSDVIVMNTPSTLISYNNAITSDSISGYNKINHPSLQQCSPVSNSSNNSSSNLSFSQNQHQHLHETAAEQENSTTSACSCVQESPWHYRQDVAREGWFA